MPRVLLVLPSATYRAAEFLDAAAAVGAEVVCASNEPQALAAQMGDRFLELDLTEPEASAVAIVELASRSPLDAVIGVDDQGVLTAALAARALGLVGNPPEAVVAARDKVTMRAALRSKRVAQPSSIVIERSGDWRNALAEHAAWLGFPAVLKPSNQAASRGVIRVDDTGSLLGAADRIEAILARDRDGTSPLLLERFVAGPEIALEGLLEQGALRVLAHFDKPDPLDGPFFEETIYVTPSRHDVSLLSVSADLVQRACAAMGLVEGPVHAELRLSDEGPVIIEVAARTIGGRCAKALSFTSNKSLETVVLEHALALRPGEAPPQLSGASGVMMLPIPATGRLVAIGGRSQALAVTHITGLEISIPLGHRIEALPEGSRYLGFLFAKAEEPSEVEAALRQAHSLLDVRVEPALAGEAA